MDTLHVDLRAAPKARPDGPRAEALRAAGQLARLAAFAAMCALYVLLRYAVLRPRRACAVAAAPASAASGGPAR